MTTNWADDIVGEILFDSDQIHDAVERLGKEITRDYLGKDLLIVCVLRGASIFMADLIRKIELPCEIDFISVSSYGQSTKSSGVVRIIKDLAVPIEGKDVLFVEDVVDTGLTWAYLKQLYEARGPRTVKMCTLLDKPDARKKGVEIDYSGFIIEDRFVVGYGLDWKEKYRNLPYIMVPKS
ncbi:MAG: hypoxanthine phosphoribosyltransferase [Candidatus Lindowbacteria bacterium]|nr:hypoxanthine phosphoribosyltransferase [Candidatus Lindowbacteria bacterium]